MRAINTFDPETGNLFQTYAAAIAENAMMDYVRKCISAIPYTGRILSLDAPAPGYDPADDVTYGAIILDEYSKTPEQIFIKKETIEEVRNALQMISDRERAYLHYRYGFADELQHDQSETAAHFHLSTSRAKSIERLRSAMSGKHFPDRDALMFVDFVSLRCDTERPGFNSLPLYHPGRF